MKFVAEIGLNHNGNMGLLEPLIREAAFSGADFAKFQLGWRGEPGELNYLERGHIDKIIKLCDIYQVCPLFSVFTREAFETLNEFNLSSVKIASRTVKDDQQLCLDLIEKFPEVFVSLGFWEDASSLPFFEKNNISYMQCIAEYPTEPWNFKLARNFDKKVCGYSDHTVGIEGCLFAISRGATLIEKHFTLDKSDVTIRDHACSATPDEFSQMVNLSKKISLYSLNHEV